jgi:hypothetical protein
MNFNDNTVALENGSKTMALLARVSREMFPSRGDQALRKT